MMMTAAAYAEQLRQLLPRGRAWLTAPGSLLAQLLAAFGDELARADDRIAGLIDEADPLTTLELLPDWERVAGLPDACLPVTGSISDRQIRVARKISGQGGQSRAFFIDLAGQLGLEIEIEEFSPATCGHRLGSHIGGPQWRFVWRVTVLPPTEESATLAIRTSIARCGSRCGVRIRSFSIQELECVIRRAAPAHSKVLFAYPVDPEPMLWFDFLSNSGDY